MLKHEVSLIKNEGRREYPKFRPFWRLPQGPDGGNKSLWISIAAMINRTQDMNVNSFYSEPLSGIWWGFPPIPVFLNGHVLKISLWSATDELALSETSLAGGQKQNRTFTGSVLLLKTVSPPSSSSLWCGRPDYRVLSPLVVHSFFEGFPSDRYCA